MNWKYLERIVRMVRRPVTFPALKIYLFSLLVGGVTLDWLVKIDVEKKLIDVMSGSDDFVIPIMLVIVLVLLVVIDWRYFNRQQRFRRKILDIIANPGIPQKIKDRLIDLLL